MVFPLLSKSNRFCITVLHDWLKKNSRHFFIQSEVKPNPIVIGSHSFSRALRQLHVITQSSFDWFTVVLPAPSVIGQSYYIGFGFTTQLKLS